MKSKVEISNSIFHAVNFIDVLFSQYSSNGLVEVRCLGKSKPPQSFFKSPKNLTKNHEMESILKSNEDGYNIYVGVNPRPSSQKKRQKDIKDVICLWLDVDGKNFDGGKEEAFEHIIDFTIPPNIIVDSGNGYHVYWILEKPLINITESERTEIKQILSGLALALKADRQALNLDRVMRLPGTLNLKVPKEPKETHMEMISPYYFFSLDDFCTFKDYQYVVDEREHMADLDFGKKEMIVCRDNPEKAIKDVERLEVSKKIKRMIITGRTLSGEGVDHTRSGRDMAIILSLVAADYTYKTIKGIFFNKRLGCSDRIGERGERQLKYEVAKARKLLLKEEKYSPQVQEIRRIKNTQELTSEEKLRAISNYIIEDLFSSQISIGSCYKNEKRKRYYFFDKSQKLLMDIEGTDFHCFLKKRYDLPKKDFEEVMDCIKAHIWDLGKEIEVHDLAYFDNEKNVLYISNHDNQIYRLNGKAIELVDNGTDGVIFEYKPNYVPFHVDLNDLNSVHYFERGFSWETFRKGDSYVYKYLIGRTNFAIEERHNLTAVEQQYLLTNYVYSLFFESILQEKPILCLEGVKASGKSFIAESIGKVLIGDKFLPNHLSENRRDFHVALSENSYIVFDNVDASINSGFLNDLCIAATGGEINTRKLYTDREEIRSTPHIFIAITSRDPRFKRDDFVDRLLLFNTEKVKNPKARSALFKELREYRNRIWAELLVNLNSIVALLKQKASWNPPGIFRIADWELFCKKTHPDEKRDYIIGLLEKMNKEKSRFSLEDDPFYILLRYVVYEQNEGIEDLMANQLYEKLIETSMACKMEKAFERRYKSPMSIAKRIANIKEELSDEFAVEISESPHAKTKVYNFRKKEIGSIPRNVSEQCHIDNYERKEREAIMEVNGGLTREQAEREALASIIKEETNGEVVR